MIDEKPPIGAEEVAEATAILQKYKADPISHYPRAVPASF